MDQSHPCTKPGFRCILQFCHVLSFHLPGRSASLFDCRKESQKFAKKGRDVKPGPLRLLRFFAAKNHFAAASLHGKRVRDAFLISIRQLVA